MRRKDTRMNIDYQKEAQKTRLTVDMNYSPWLVFCLGLSMLLLVLSPHVSEIITLIGKP